MKTLYPLHGIAAVVNTPFDESGNVDLRSLSRHFEYAIDNSVAGILVPALAAEVYSLSQREKLEMVKLAVETAQNRCLIIGCATSANKDERLDIAKMLINTGCDGINAVIPYENDAQYLSEVKALAALRPPMLMLQDWSSGYGLSDELIIRIFEEIDCFRCLKVETVPAGIKYSRMLELSGGRLNVSGGWAVMQMLEALDRGVHAMMPTGMYEIYIKIYTLYNSGMREKAKLLFYALLPVLAFCNQKLESSIWFLKRLLMRQGIYRTDLTRLSGFRSDVQMRRTADELIDYVLDLSGRVKAGDYD